MIYTGPVDAFFDYRYGKLPYRSLEFRHETHRRRVFQEAPVVNYPNGQPYTRITEFKYLTGQDHRKTGIVYEYPKAEGDPYYPIPRPENTELYGKYQALAEARTGRTFRRPSRDVQVLQHGPDRRPGADRIRQDRWPQPEGSGEDADSSSDDRLLERKGGTERPTEWGRQVRVLAESGSLKTKRGSELDNPDCLVFDLGCETVRRFRDDRSSSA